MMDKNNPDILESVSFEGKCISPNLPESINNYLIDIDGTICDDVPNEEPERMLEVEAYPSALIQINKWFEQGHIITFFTSRLEEHREITENWLKLKGFNYHSLILGKPRGGNYHWIDSRKVESIRYKNKFNEVVKKGLTPKL